MTADDPLLAEIRAETPADVARIHAVHAAAFPTTDEAELVDALRASGRLSLSLVAVARERIIGHVAFSPVTVEGATAGLGLAPVAVLPAFRRRGVAGRLIREGLERSRRANARFVVVLGSPPYYGRFGFRPASTFQLRDEYGGEEAFQALELQAGSIPTAGGLVRYAPEFARFGA